MIFQWKSLLALVAIVAIIKFFPFSFSDWRYEYRIKPPLDRIQGEVVSAWTVREETEEEWPIFGYKYIFYSPELGQFEGIGYGENLYLDTGHEVTVLYSRENPFYNKAANLGVSRNRTDTLVIWTLFILTCIGFLLYQIIRSYFNIWIIENGTLQIARQCSKEVIEHDSYTQYNYTYKYVMENGKVRMDKFSTQKGKKMRKSTPIVFYRQQVVYIATLPKPVEEFVVKEFTKDQKTEEAQATE